MPCYSCSLIEKFTIYSLTFFVNYDIIYIENKNPERVERGIIMKIEMTMKDLKEYLNNDSFMSVWKVYQTSDNYKGELDCIIDLIYNYDCEKCSHMKATDTIRQRINELFEELKNNTKEEDEEWNEYYAGKIDGVIDYILATDINIIKMLVEEW